MNLIIPKGCSCKDVHFGDYSNQVEIKTPPHMLEIGEIDCYSFRETTCVDACISDLVRRLWEHGIVTTGSCCGHNKKDGYIGIYQPKEHMNGRGNY